jgi:superfamily II DNA helicase RecQ
LRELARLKPSTLEALHHVYGMGARKTEDLGQAVLDTIRAHREQS